MSVEIDIICDNPACGKRSGKRIRKDEFCYCHDCYTEGREAIERLEKEVQELEQRLTVLSQVHP